MITNIKDNVTCVNADCFDYFPNIKDNSVDMILCDLPFGNGTTSCKWDKRLPMVILWNEYKRIIKKNGAIVLFGTEPFNSLLRVSNLDMFKYDWIWIKNAPVGFVNAKRKTMPKHEIISVFSKGKCANPSNTYKGDNSMIYYPQGLKPINKLVNKYKSEESKHKENTYYRQSHKETYIQEFTNYPTTTLFFNKTTKTIHPTEKPVKLLEYLIRTYTQEGELVLDNCAGSFSTGEACINTNRHFIGIEKETRYYNLGVDRLKHILIKKQQQLFP